MEEEQPLVTQTSDSFFKSDISLFSSATGQEKKKNNTLSYSVYCIDNTVPKEVVEKLHGSLIKKAL